jgi:1,4-dihydroxy-2-naphthoate octaprenyltransferase
LVHRSTIQLLRFHFSYFLMPVYWFAVSFVEKIDVQRAVLIFIILHLLVYPSSNGYNSFMDRDAGSIGGIKNPLQPTKQLFFVSVIMDVAAIFLSAFISTLFAICVLIYIIFSRLYSYRGVRLKQYPLTGYLIVIITQGSLTFFMVYHGSDINLTNHMSWLGLLAAAFLIGGFYPITQVYQHEADKKDNVTSISMLLGTKRTFIFCAVMYMVAMIILWLYYSARELYMPLIVLLIFFLPVVVYFMQWFLKVLKDENKADFKHTMQMNWLASTCTSLAFITIILLQKIG